MRAKPFAFTRCVAWFVLASAWVCGAPAADTNEVRESVDEVTAATITSATRALVFAQERTDLAANARDYLTLTPIEINRAGQRSCYWFGYLWSTIDRRGRPAPGPNDEWVLLADGRPIPLKFEPRRPHDLGMGQPPIPAPVRGAVTVMIPATSEEIDYVARAGELRVQHVRVDGNETFSLWRGAPQPLLAFAGRVSQGC